jgi:hypothetical protein
MGRERRRILAWQREGQKATSPLPDCREGGEEKIELS